MMLGRLLAKVRHSHDSRTIDDHDTVMPANGSGMSGAGGKDLEERVGFEPTVQ